MTENILESFSLKFDHGNPEDYTWIDLGQAKELSKEEFLKLRPQFPDLFESEIKSLFLPFEKMGIVRKLSNGQTLSTTIERHSEKLQVFLRGKGGDVAEIVHTSTREKLVRIGEKYSPDKILEAMREQDPESAKKEYIDTFSCPEEYLGTMWMDMVLSVYLRYMHVSVDLKETVTAYTAMPSAANAKRVRKNKKPIYTWTVIDVTAQHEKEEIVATGNGHASPRRHRRRGHFRQYLSGRRTWVNEMMVGKIEFGYAQHSYTAHSKKESVNG